MNTTKTHEPMDVGVPYASLEGDGPVSTWYEECPVCGERFYVLPRSQWKDSETPRTGYAQHYADASRDA